MTRVQEGCCNTLLGFNMVTRKTEQNRAPVCFVTMHYHQIVSMFHLVSTCFCSHPFFKDASMLICFITAWSCDWISESCSDSYFSLFAGITAFYYSHWKALLIFWHRTRSAFNISCRNKFIQYHPKNYTPEQIITLVKARKTLWHSCYWLWIRTSFFIYYL